MRLLGLRSERWGKLEAITITARLQKYQLDYVNLHYHANKPNLSWVKGGLF